MDAVEEIRTAATRLRETAERTSRAPWSTNGMWVMGADSHIAHFGGHLPNRDWVALAHPGLAEPLAAWLEEVADDAEKHARGGWGNSADEIACGWPLAVARLINGSD
ncbi:hypothetical protein [Streptosporangium sp. NPDC051022]|uniref:hypothetical protein n=1 Tax=Streptosporangium sp. NPDC051022 TaxID=3155752 RepID=UPI00341570E6